MRLKLYKLKQEDYIPKLTYMKIYHVWNTYFTIRMTQENLNWNLISNMVSKNEIAFNENVE